MALHVRRVVLAIENFHLPTHFFSRRNACIQFEGFRRHWPRRRNAPTAARASPMVSASRDYCMPSLRSSYRAVTAPCCCTFPSIDMRAWSHSFPRPYLHQQPRAPQCHRLAIYFPAHASPLLAIPDASRDSRRRVSHLYRLFSMLPRLPAMAIYKMPRRAALWPATPDDKFRLSLFSPPA